LGKKISGEDFLTGDFIFEIERYVCEDFNRTI